MSIEPFLDVKSPSVARMDFGASLSSSKLNVPVASFL